MMRSGFLVLLITTVLFAGGYFYYTALAICPVPLEYRIGVLDERFGISEEEAKLAAVAAESIWEDATGRNLFTYDDKADFVINFVFDDRQALVDAEDNLKDRLDAAENANDTIAHTHADLVKEYEGLKQAYETRVSNYEVSLQTYNDKVQQYNDEGGAPPEEYDRLQTEKGELDREQVELNKVVRQLNNLVEEINQVGKEGNQLVETYNRGVDTYNQTFGEPREFTQGDYQGDKINIYTFANDNELELVLAHELGHALHLGHVAGEQSVMYYLIGDQPDQLELSSTDIEEFNRVCGSSVSSLLERLKIAFGL